MSKKLIISSLKSDNVAGNKLEKDANGYYRIPLGALNVINSANEFYTSRDVLDIIQDNSSTLVRRMNSGQLRGEVGHPRMTPGMTDNEYLSEILRIRESNVSHHIKSLEVEYTTFNPGVVGEGNTIIIWGWLKPAGVHGAALEAAINNPDENVAFSIRSLVGMHYDKKNRINVKKITQIITWDWVNEPGIKYATKWKAMGLESIDYCVIDLDNIISPDNTMTECMACAMEHNGQKEVLQEVIDRTLKEANFNTGKIIW